MSSKKITNVRRFLIFFFLLALELDFLKTVILNQKIFLFSLHYGNNNNYGIIAGNLRTFHYWE